MKKIFIATCSVIAISGALGTFPAWSDPPSAEEKELKALELRMKTIKDKMIKDKTKTLEAQKHDQASEVAVTQVSDALAPLMKALEAFGTPSEPKVSDISIPGLSGALPDNPFLKAVVNAGIKYFTDSSALMDKASHTGGLVTALGPVLASVSDDTKLMMCQAITPLIGISEKLCPTFFGSKK